MMNPNFNLGENVWKLQSRFVFAFDRSTIVQNYNIFLTMFLKIFSISRMKTILTPWSVFVISIAIYFMQKVSAVIGSSSPFEGTVLRVLIKTVGIIKLNLESSLNWLNSVYWDAQHQTKRIWSDHWNGWYPSPSYGLVCP